MDDKNVQNEALNETEPIVEDAKVNTEAEVVDTTVMPKTDFTGYVGEETVVTVAKEKEKNGLAVASMVCGICGAVFGILELCCCCWPLSMVASILAIIFALVDRSKKGSFNGKTITGLVCGIVGILAPLFLLVLDFTLTFNGDFSQFMEEIEKAFEEGMQQGNQ